MKLEDLERFDPVLSGGTMYYSYAEMEPAVSGGDWVRFEDVKKLQPTCPTCPHCQTSMTMCKEWKYGKWERTRWVSGKWEYSWKCQCGPDSNIPDAVEIN